MTAAIAPAVETEIIDLYVTHEHIRTGNPGYPHSCAVALAFRSAGFKSPSVGGNGVVSIWSSGTVWEPTDADMVRKWIARFDVGLHVTPERFKFRRLATAGPPRT